MKPRAGRRGFAAIFWAAALAAVLLAGAALTHRVSAAAARREAACTAESQARRAAEGALAAAVAGLDRRGSVWRPAPGDGTRLTVLDAGRVELRVHGHPARLVVTLDDAQPAGRRVTAIARGR